MLEGKLHRHIVAKSGIKVDPDQVQDITYIPHLVTKKSMQSFLGKINFLEKFISDNAQIVKPMQYMIKKDTVYSWGKREKNAFTCIKQAIVEALALYIPYFNKYFLLSTFTSDN